MVRGTRNLFGEDAILFNQITRKLVGMVEGFGFIPFIPSALAEQQVFIDKAGSEVLNQMYVFRDRKERDLCLIPEVTAVVQKLYKEEWQSMKKPIQLYYLTRCYRYERPQAGRYREFWQFGVEILGGGPDDKEQAEDLLKACMIVLDLEDKYVFNSAVKRGLDYYIEDGFELEIPTLGAQKQVAGGGRYEGGIGWAIGVDRLMLALQK